MKLERFADLTAGSAFFLLLAGAMVTSTGSGLAVPDWPLAYGQYFPPMVGGIFFEHGHRMVAGIVGLMTLALSGWILARESSKPLRVFAGCAAVGILVQAGLGGATVLLLLPPQISITHGVLGQTVFCLLLALADEARSLRLAGPVDRAAGRHFKRLTVAAAAVYGQLILGAILRHTGSGLHAHMAGAALVTAIALHACYKVVVDGRPASSLKVPVWTVVILIPLQIALGLSVWIMRARPAVSSFWYAVLPSLHVVTGAAILGSCAVLALRARRAARQ